MCTGVSKSCIASPSLPSQGFSKTPWVHHCTLPKENLINESLNKLQIWAEDFFKGVNEVRVQGKQYRQMGKLRIKEFVSNYSRCIEDIPDFLYLFNSAIDTEPKNFKNHFYQGKAHFVLKNYRLALQSFDKAKLLVKFSYLSEECQEKTYALLEACMASCYEAIGDYQLAYDHYCLAELNNPISFYGKHKEGLYRRVYKKDQKDIADCKLLIRHKPSCPYHYIDLGIAYMQEKYPRKLVLGSLKTASNLAKNTYDSGALKIIEAILEKIQTDSTVSSTPISVRNLPSWDRSSW